MKKRQERARLETSARHAWPRGLAHSGSSPDQWIPFGRHAWFANEGFEEGVNHGRDLEDATAWTHQHLSRRAYSQRTQVHQDHSAKKKRPALKRALLFYAVELVRPSTAQYGDASDRTQTFSYRCLGSKKIRPIVVSPPMAFCHGSTVASPFRARCQPTAAAALAVGLREAVVPRLGANGSAVERFVASAGVIPLAVRQE